MTHPPHPPRAPRPSRQPRASRQPAAACGAAFPLGNVAVRDEYLLRRKRQNLQHLFVSLAVILVAVILKLPSAHAQQQPADDVSPIAQQNNLVTLNFQDATLDAVLHHLSEAAGLVIVKDVDLPGRVTVISRQPLTPNEAVEVVNSVLKQKGLAAVRIGRTLRIVPFDTAKRSNIPVRVGSNPQHIAESDELITQVMPIRHADAARLVQDLTPMISAGADIAANASSNVIIMTDTSANVRRVAQIIAAVDTTVASVATIRVFALQYANASDAARLINEIFREGGQAGAQQQQQQRRAAAFRRMAFARRGQEAGNQADDPSGRSEAPVVAAADDRTNTLVVSGPEDTLELVSEVLSELDANPAASQSVFVYTVRHGRAVNLQQVLTNLFGTQTTGTRSAGDPRTAPLRGAAGPEGRGMRTDPVDQVQSRLGGAAGQTPNQQTRQRGRGQAPAQLSPESLASASDLLGQVYVVADEDTNSLLVMTAPINFQRVQQIIAELDRPAPQVLIKVLIAEVTHSDAIDVGAEFSILNIPNGSSLFTDLGVAAATGGGMVYRLLESDIQATIRALERVGKLEVLSRPYILASDNQEAAITVGQEVPFITSTNFTELGGTRSTVRYQDVGIILRVTPHINTDGLVIMDIMPEISAISGESIEISPGVNAPVIAKRSAQSRVSIEDGRTIVIGGLMEDQQNQTIRKVPLLGDIPLLGLLFQRNETEKRKTELLIFLTPHVATQAQVLDELSKEEAASVEVVPEAIEPGTFEHHLRRMQRGAYPQPRQDDEFDASDVLLE